MSVLEEDIHRIISENPGMVDRLEGKSFLITGSTGMIGQYITSLLLEIAKKRNTSNVIIANARNESKALSVFTNYRDMRQFKLLVSDATEISEIDHKIDYILHAASPTQPQDFQERPVDIIKSNVNATDNLLNLAQQKTARFCLLSTLEVYGSVSGELVDGLVSVTESDFGSLDSLSLRSTYPESKRLAENMCIAYKRQFGVNSTIVRLAPTISPVIAPDDKRVFAQFVRNAATNQDITIYSDAADKKRSYTYIADAVSGILTATLNSTDDNFVFNLANNKNIVSIQELAKIIISETPNTKSTLVISQRSNDSNTSTSTGVIRLDSQNLLDTGWSPVYSITESVRRVVSGYR